MVGWLIYREEDYVHNKRAVQLFQESAKKLGMRLYLKIYPKDTLQSGAMPDFVINRSREYDLALWFETQGVRVFNSSEVTRICNDKERTLEFAQNLGLPVLPWVSGTMCSEKECHYPAIAKSCSGHGGTEVFWVESIKQLRQVKTHLSDKKWILQQPASELGKDLRVYVLGGRPLKAMLRTSKDDFRSNYSLGGCVSEYAFSAEIQNMIQRITKVMHLDYVGIDFLFHRGKMVLNEIEDVVGARMLYMHTELDIILEYMKYIRNQI